MSEEKIDLGRGKNDNNFMVKSASMIMKCYFIGKAYG